METVEKAYEMRKEILNLKWSKTMLEYERQDPVRRELMQKARQCHKDASTDLSDFIKNLEAYNRYDAAIQKLGGDNV